MEAKWENVPGSVKGIVRMRTSGGWVIAAVNTAGAATGVAYMADKSHNWLKPKSD